MTTMKLLPFLAVFVFLACKASATVRYVDLNCTNATSPYTSWATAATNIQDAVSIAASGDLILVTNGIYQTGSYSSSGLNRVAVLNAMTVQSVNGPAATVIKGGSNNVFSVVRCVYLVSGAVLSGFTLTNGATSGNNGGGVYCQSNNAVVTNCVITGNAASGSGGGAYSGTLINCVIANNSASGDGGGAYTGTLNNCLVTGNSALDGGAVMAIMSATPTRVNNCTIYGNSASRLGGGLASLGLGAPSFLSASNCIVFGNTAPSGSNYALGFAMEMMMNYCCTAPVPTGAANNSPGGANNFTNDPLFLNPAIGDFHLQSNSPCINSGNNAFVTNATDLDGNPRIVGGTVDIGAYEFQSPSSILSYAWAQQYGLPTDGSADFIDSDATGMNNWQKWIAGLNPTNPASVLVLLPPVATNNTTGVTVSWQSVSNRTYYLQRGSDLMAQPVFSVIQSNIIGQAGTTSITDTAATNGGSYFYRVGVQ